MIDRIEDDEDETVREAPIKMEDLVKLTPTSEKPTVRMKPIGKERADG